MNNPLNLTCPLPLAIITRDMRDVLVVIGIIKWPKKTPKSMNFLKEKKILVTDNEGHADLLVHQG